MGSVISNLFGGDDAADAARDASAAQVGQQRQALQYLQQREALPLQLRDQALMGLGATYLPGGMSSPQTGTASGYAGYLSNYGPQQFNEQAYLAANPDVAAAVQSGDIPSGSYHYYKWGQNEGRSMGQPPVGPEGAIIEGSAEALDPNWMYDRAFESPLYQGLRGKSQEELLADAQNSALYQAIMSGRNQGEQAILRNASATGGLRSGNSIEDLANFNTNLQNRALLSSYEEALRQDDLDRRALLTSFNDVSGGLRGLAGLGGSGTDIANLYSSIGASQAAGITGAAQAEQDALGLGLNTILGGLSLFDFDFSDIRLKKNIQPLKQVNGHNWYTWEWNEVAEQFGLSGEADGVLAHEVYEYLPEAVGSLDGYMVVNYGRLLEEDRKRIH